MNIIKKAAITAGAVAGGVIGGTVALAGKMTGAGVVEELGDGIVDSAIMTGELVGEALSGTADMVAGGIRKDADQVAEGRHELQHAVKTTIGNAVNNIRIIGSSSAGIVGGMVHGDRQKVVCGLKNLGKMAAIGLVTVGVVKATQPDGGSVMPEGKSKISEE